LCQEQHTVVQAAEFCPGHDLKPPILIHPPSISFAHAKISLGAAFFIIFHFFDPGIDSVAMSNVYNKISG